MSKIFIIGLPRTGTTSLCASLLNAGYKVAHTAYTIEAVTQADVIADTPAFVDYPFFDQHYPGSKFIYLERDFKLWEPSIKQLLMRMDKNINNDSGGFNPILKRCYRAVFNPFDPDHINCGQHLLCCFSKHRAEVLSHFVNKEDQLLTLDISQDGSIDKLADFWQIEFSEKQFPHLNKGQKIIGWNKIQHPNKISANLPGKLGRKYFCPKKIADA